MLIAKQPLLRDLGKFSAGMGGVLTTIGLKNTKEKRNIEVRDVNFSYALQKGRGIFDRLCKNKAKELNNFKVLFCDLEKNELKPNSELRYNDIQDMAHIGSSIILGEKEFITADENLGKLNPFIDEIEIKTEI